MLRVRDLLLIGKHCSRDVLVSLGKQAGGKAYCPPAAEEELSCLRHSKLLHKADRVALLAAAATAQLQDSLPPERSDLAVIAASARGATTLLEQEHERFVRHGTTAAAASPQTTAGMLAALISNFITSTGLSCTLSATCASGMHALGTALYYLRGGGSKHALCVASEAPLTPFVLRMLHNARVLSQAARTERFPVRPLHHARDGLVLAEGAAAVHLCCEPHTEAVRIAGYGAAREQGVSLTGVSTAGEGLVLAITRALHDAQLRPSDIDLVIGAWSIDTARRPRRVVWSAKCFRLAPAPPAFPQVVHRTHLRQLDAAVGGTCLPSNADGNKLCLALPICRCSPPAACPPTCVSAPRAGCVG